MSSAAIRAWYCAIGVNWASAVTSPAAQMPSTLVRMCSSTAIPSLVVSTPICSRFSSSTFGTRPQELGHAQLPLGASVARRQRGDDLAPVTAGALDERVGDHLDAVVLERGGQLGRRRGLGSRRDLLERVHDRDLGVEARERLAELEPDRSAAENEQRLRKLRQLQCADMVDPAD